MANGMNEIQKIARTAAAVDSASAYRPRMAATAIVNTSHRRNSMRFILAVLALLFPAFAKAQGTLPFALQQQFSFTNCTTFTNACGTPLIGGLLYFYVAGTNSQVQNSYFDQALTLPQPSPLVLDGNGRVPMFFLASGTFHVRLTDANGVTQIDVPQMLVIGPVGGGGGGSAVDPTTVASTGDIKFRATGETLAGWVKLNGTTIGNAVERRRPACQRDCTGALRLPVDELPGAALPRVRWGWRIGIGGFQREQNDHAPRHARPSSVGPGRHGQHRGGAVARQSGHIGRRGHCDDAECNWRREHDDVDDSAVADVHTIRDHRRKCCKRAIWNCRFQYRYRRESIHFGDGEWFRASRLPEPR